MKRAGNASSTPSRPWNRVSLVDGLVIAGIAVSIGLIAISAVLNFRFAYRTADTEIDAWAYGLGVALAEGIKAMCPFVMAWAWRQSSIVTVVAALTFFSIASGYSLASATGYAAQHRLTKQLVSGDEATRRQDLRRNYDRLQSDLSSLGTPRPIAILENALETILRRPIGPYTVDGISKGCTLNRSSTREACAEHAQLADELAHARARERLTKESNALQARLEERRGDPPAANAQVDTLAGVGSALNITLNRRTIEAFLAVGFALLVELGSGLGLFLVTTPWRLSAESQLGTEGRQTMTSELGYVEVFLMARLIPKRHGELTTGQIYLAYASWCRGRGFVAFSRIEFNKELLFIAQTANVTVRGNAGSEMLIDVGLRPPTEPDAPDTPRNSWRR